MRLQQKLPALAWDIEQLSKQKCMYLLALYYLETLRVESGRSNTYQAMFEYLNDEGLVMDFGKYITAIADLVFAAHLTTFDAKPHTTRYVFLLGV